MKEKLSAISSQLSAGRTTQALSEPKAEG